jgi:membrane fusion protein, heavy metal efflux system
VILSTVSGQLQAVLVQIGAAVRAGQPLARVASSELAALQNEYLKARAMADLAGTRLARDESLFEDGIIAEARLLETRATRQLALAAEQEQRKRLALAGFSEAAVRAIAPSSISGVVTIHASTDSVVLSQSAAVGQHVEPGTELFRLAGSRGAWLELHAPARSAHALSVGDVVSVPGCESPGRVIAVGSQLDPESQTFMVRAEMLDAACIRPNQYVEADVLPSAVPAGLVSVPASALVRNADRDYVFVEKEGMFSPTPVEIERRRGDVAWLRGGIAAGTRVATAGVSALKGAWLGLGPALEAPGAQ